MLRLWGRCQATLTALAAFAAFAALAAVAAALAALAAALTALAAITTTTATITASSSALLHATRRAAPVPATRECHRPSNAGGPATYLQR